MEHTQLIELIGILKTEEKEQIRQFAALPFFNQGKMKAYVPLLLEICLTYSEHKSQLVGLEKKDVFALLFPGQEFVEGKLEKVMVEAHKIVRTFLLAQHYFHKNNEFMKITHHTDPPLTV